MITLFVLLYFAIGLVFIWYDQNTDQTLNLVNRWAMLFLWFPAILAAALTPLFRK